MQRSHLVSPVGLRWPQLGQVKFLSASAAASSTSDAMLLPPTRHNRGNTLLAVVRGSWQWPIPVLAAVVCVVLAQGIWRLREWARWVIIFLLGLSMVGVICGVPGYWWQQRILPIAGVLAIICIFPPLVPLALLLYWFLSNEEYFQ